MGSQFIPNSIPRNIIIMKFLVVLSLVASAIASPIAVTPDVAKATEEHLAAHAAAAGEHAALAPAAVVNAYLDDAADVAAAKAEFQKAFDLHASGAVPLPVAPVFAPAATVASAAPVATVAAPLYNGFYGFPHLNAYGGYGTFAGINAGYPYYSGYPYAGYPYAGWGPVVTAPAAEATE